MQGEGSGEFASQAVDVVTRGGRKLCRQKDT